MACKKTSSSVTSKASKLLKDGRTSKTTKSVAALLYLKGNQNIHIRKNNKGKAGSI